MIKRLLNKLTLYRLGLCELFVEDGNAHCEIMAPGYDDL